MKTCLCGMTFDELQAYITLKGFDRIQTTKVLLAVYRKKINSINQISSIPKALKDLLYDDFVVGTWLPINSQTSSDGTVKYLFRNDKGMEFETVYLPDNKRKTVCISTQAGCRMGCPFCITGRYGFNGNLSAGDMINQIISLPVQASITHIVFMGMGEPMDNIEEVIKACRILTSDWGLAISNRNITVSTVGILPGIVEFLSRSDCNLTLSLHSPFSSERKLFVPVENIYPAGKIIETMKSFPLRKKRRLSVAYVMIKDFNDSDEHLYELIKLLTSSQIRVNLLPYHKINDETTCSSTDNRMLFFKHNLVIKGISASIRKSRGEDISAACGLLASGLRKI
jgi:23S rRNA (adenine2503-C2)-methyltransferase